MMMCFTKNMQYLIHDTPLLSITNRYDIFHFMFINAQRMSVISSNKDKGLTLGINLF